MGLNLIFDKENADLSGIAKMTYFKDRIYVSDIIQRVLVEVSENGSSYALPSSVGSNAQNIY